MGIVGNIVNVLSGESDTFNKLWESAMEAGSLENKVNSIIDEGVSLVLDGGSSAEDITQFLDDVHAPKLVKFMNDYMPGSSIVSEIDNALYNIMSQDLGGSRSIKDAKIGIELWDEGVNLYENPGMANYTGGFSNYTFTEAEIARKPDLVAQYLGLEPVSLDQVDRPSDNVLESFGLDASIKGGENWYSIDEWRFPHRNPKRLIEPGIVDIQNYFTLDVENHSFKAYYGIMTTDEARKKMKVKETVTFNKPLDQLGWLSDDYFNKLTQNMFYTTSSTESADYNSKFLYSNPNQLKQLTRFDLLEHELNMFKEAGWVNLSTYDDTSPVLNEIFETIYGGQGLDISTFTKVLRYDKDDDKYYLEIFDMWDFGEGYKESWGDESDMNQAAWDIAIDFVDAAGSPINMYDKYEIPKKDIEYLINSAQQKSFD